MKAEEIRKWHGTFDNANVTAEVARARARIEIAAQLSELNQNLPAIRDLFAMAAIQGVMMGDPALLWEDPRGHAKATQQVFAWADAMMRARER